MSKPKPKSKLEKALREIAREAHPGWEGTPEEDSLARIHKLAKRLVGCPACEAIIEWDRARLAKAEAKEERGK